MPEELCEDEGCPHHGTPHVCVSSRDLVTVCSKCLRAACWQGEFYCDNAKSAGTVKKTRAELKALAFEHPSYWK